MEFLEFFSDPSVPVAIVEILVGLFLLSKAADLFVDGAAEVAVAAKMSPVVIGAVVVGFGTSAPELLVSGIAASGGDADLGLGNIVEETTDFGTSQVEDFYLHVSYFRNSEANLCGFGEGVRIGSMLQSDDSVLRSQTRSTSTYLSSLQGKRVEEGIEELRVDHCAQVLYLIATSKGESVREVVKDLELIAMRWIYAVHKGVVFQGIYLNLGLNELTVVQVS